MASGTTRIPRTIRGFDPHIKALIAYLLLFSVETPNITNAVRLGITVAELAELQLFFDDWELLMIKYSSKKTTRTTDVKDKLLQIIKNYVANDKKIHLYERVAISTHANTTDFETFNIKQGTPLAKTSDSRAADPGTDEEVIVISKIGNLYHELLVTTAEKKGRSKGKGVKDIMIFKAVTLVTAGAPPLTAYIYVGDTLRGFITVAHDESEKGKTAWYIARIKNTRGVVGVASAAVGATII